MIENNLDTTSIKNTRLKSKHSRSILIDNEKKKITQPLSQSLTELKYSSNEIKNIRFITFDQINEQKIEKNTEILKTVKEQIFFIEDLLKWFTEVGEPKFFEIDVRSMPSSLICCYNILNNNESNELSYDFQIKQELNNMLQKTEVLNLIIIFFYNLKIT